MDYERHENNLIYFASFISETNLKLAKLMLNSLLLFGNVNFQTTKVLMLTSPDMKKKLEKMLNLGLYNIDFMFMEANSIAEASLTRNKIFEYPNIDQYKKILYVDTDVLFMNDVNKIFDLELEEKLYTIPDPFFSIDLRPTIEDPWGYMKLFSEHDKNSLATEDYMPFCAGILLFPNSIVIKELFVEWHAYFSEFKYFDTEDIGWWDQPFINHLAKKYKLSNTALLEPLARNFYDINDMDVSKDRILGHFLVVKGITVHVKGCDLYKMDHMIKMINHLLILKIQE